MSTHVLRIALDNEEMKNIKSLIHPKGVILGIYFFHWEYKIVFHLLLASYNFLRQFFEKCKMTSCSGLNLHTFTWWKIMMCKQKMDNDNIVSSVKNNNVSYFWPVYWKVFFFFFLCYCFGVEYVEIKKEFLIHFRIIHLYSFSHKKSSGLSLLF